MRGGRRGRYRSVGHAVRVGIRKRRRQTAVRRSAQQLQPAHQARRQQLRSADGQNGPEAVPTHRSGESRSPTYLLCELTILTGAKTMAPCTLVYRQRTEDV